MMDDLERRLTAALRAEADKLEPSSTSWSGRRLDSARRGPATWLAVAAVVAVLVVGVTVAVGRSRGTAGHPAAPAGPDPAACAGGWSGYGTAVVAGRGQRVPAGTSAVLRFAGGTPPSATLCAVISGPGTSTGYPTLASGVAGYRDAALGYLAVLGGDESFVVGAFGTAVASVTIDDVLAPQARGPRWSIALTASTPGVTDLGNGWHGYAVLVPVGSASIQVTAVSTAGAKPASTRLAVPAARATTAPTSAANVRSPTPLVRTTPPPAVRSTAPSSSPAPPCAATSAVVGSTDVGPGGASIEADYDAASRTMCFVDSRGSVRHTAKAGALPFSGTTLLGSGPGVWGAVTSAATTVTLTDQQHPAGQVLDLQALGTLRFYYTGISGRATITVFGAGAKHLATVTY